MGLGGQRKRTKFSHDPNNTAWTNATDGYGKRMLQSRGWTPGASLGARHKSYTRAEGITHIKVTLKDDNLGLGAKSGPNVPQPGLDAFQGLLGRLNGKTDTELVKQQITRDDVRRRTYAERRWGGLNFVSGGLLVGDRIEEPEEGQPSKSVLVDGATTSAPIIVPSKTEGVGGRDITSSNEDSPAGTELKPARKSKKRKKHSGSERDGSKARAMENGVAKAPMADCEVDDDVAARGVNERVEITDKARRRAEKAQRKVDRRARKEAKSQREAVVEPTTTDVEVKNDSTMDEVERPVVESRQREKNGRNAVRQRYIMQRKMALADPRALNEILMIKA